MKGSILYETIAKKKIKEFELKFTLKDTLCVFSSKLQEHKQAQARI